MDELISCAKQYEKAHKCFLQILLKKKILLVSDVGVVFQLIVKDYYEIAYFQLDPTQNKELTSTLVEQFNTQLRTVGMRVMQVPDESRLSTEYITIVSDRNYVQPLALAVGFSSDELVVFKMWLKMMYQVDDNSSGERPANGSVSVVQHKGSGELEMEKAANIKCNGTRLSAAEKLIDKFARCHWLIKDYDRFVIRLHPCAIAEISNSLLSELQLPFCELCNRGIFLRRLALTCSCGADYHVRCVKKLLTLPIKCQSPGCYRMLTEEMLEPYEFDAEVMAAGHPTQDPNRTSQMDRTLTQEGLSHSKQAKKRRTQSQRHRIKREVPEDNYLSDSDQVEEVRVEKTVAPPPRRQSMRRVKRPTNYNMEMMDE